MKVVFSLFDIMAAGGYIGLACGLYFIGWPYLVCFAGLSLMAAGVAGQRGHLNQRRE